MGLPKIDYPTYETKITSYNGPIKFRPFVSKEEKILLMALAGEDKEEMNRALRQVVGNCILNKDFDVERIPTFDLEYLFVVIRAKSVADTVTLKFDGRKGTDCDACKSQKEVEINLNEVKIDVRPDHSNKIKLTDTIGVVMKYPSSEQLLNLMVVRNSLDIELQYKLVASCIQMTYDDVDSYEVTDEKLSSVIDWLEGLSSTHFAKIFSFFDTMPKLQHTIDLSCGKCGHKEFYTIEGVEGFFM